MRQLFPALLLLPLLAQAAQAQHAPGMGYMFPPGAQAGTTTEVILGGYDWTPDMQVFVHDPRIRLEITGPPGPVIVPEPPYWFGKKARRSPFLLPREFPAKLTIPAGVEPGIIRWQAANANGATAVGRFVVGDLPEVIEQPRGESESDTIQDLPELPVTVSGQILKIEEVDRYQFTAPATGLVHCELVAPGVGSELTAAVEVRDADGKLLASTADTTGNDAALTFKATAGHSYVVSLYDVDFRGNRAFVYRLSVHTSPRIIAAIPPTGVPGQTQTVEFVGYGLASGEPELESISQPVKFPATPGSESFLYRIQTPHGESRPFRLYLDSNPVTTEPAGPAPTLTAPATIAGVLDERYGEDRYTFSAKKGESWSITALAEAIGSPLDLSLAVFDDQGVELMRNDDVGTSTDAALQFTARADGEYQIGLSDTSGHSGTRAAVYQLSLKPARPDLALSAPEMMDAPIGGTASLTLSFTRTGNFENPVPVTIEGLPPGVTVPEKLEITPKLRSLKIPLTVAEDAAATASFAKISVTFPIDDGSEVTRTTGPILVATTIPAPFVVDAEGKDDVTKWPRGTTFPAPVLIERNEGFDGVITLEMTSKQGRHRQGIRGPELKVEPGVNRILYPVFLPEWLETTRTSRMILNGVAKVKDPQGNERYSLVRQKTRMGFLPTGAMLKLDADVTEFTAVPGEQIRIPLSISRARELAGPLNLELHHTRPAGSIFSVTEQQLAADVTRLTIPVEISSATEALGESDSNGISEHTLTLRVTGASHGDLPVVSETTILVQLKHK